MFEMTVQEVFSMPERNIFAVYGECNDCSLLKPGKVKDETGREYAFSRVLGVDLVFEDSKIELQLIGTDIDLEALKGRKLYQ